MWTTRHCRHCGDKHHKINTIPVKKIKQERLLGLVREYITAKARAAEAADYVFKEEIAGKFRVRTHYVEQCLHVLNREGLIEKPIHKAPHDSRRDPWCHGGDSAWIGDIYYIRKERLGL